MKKQLISLLTAASMALSPLTALAVGVDGSRPPKNKCGKDMKEMLNELWKSEKRNDLKEEFRGYYQTPKAERTMTEREFCDAIAEAYQTEAKFCGAGECRQATQRKPHIKEDAQEIVEATRPPVYREERVVQVQAPPPVQRSGPIMGGGGGDGGGMMMMMGMNGNRNQGGSMFPPPRGGPFGQPPAFMPIGGQGGRPPPYMPLSRPQLGGGQYPYSQAMAGYGGYGGVAQYNGAQFYNGGGYGAPAIVGGGYGGAGSYSQNYFANPGPAPSIINPSTGMRTYSVMGR